MKKLVYILICMLSFACSDEFLDKRPNINRDVEITSIDDLDKLFNGIEIPELNNQVNIWCTDNSSMPQSIIDETLGNAFQLEQIDQFLFATSINRIEDDSWKDYYENILLPNLALELIAKGNLIDEDPALKQVIVAEAHFYRAFLFFVAAVEYTLYPNTANSSELGLVLRQTSSLTESFERKTLEETFAFIISELEEALKFPDNTPKRSIFRLNKASISAFAARVYLYLGDYDKAKTHADDALNAYNTMIDYATSIEILPFPFRGFTAPNVVLQDPFGRRVNFVEDNPDHYFHIISENRNSNISPSQELMDLYDPTDIRNLFFIKDWFASRGATTNLWYTYANSRLGVALVGPSVPEMYLTRAECKARNNNITGAMVDLEIVRIHRFHPADYVALPIPTSIKETVEVIIDERRREDPFEYRYMDIKRLNNDDLTDPIILTKSLNGNSVTIQPDDRRYARPIGEEIISLSDGITQQNEY